MATTATVAVTTVATPAAAASAAGSEEETAKKKNTDCVYFLASPLTCKKGEDCEFRHSESARLNPRDCWYWVGGNCLNRDCPFRHPPLEARPSAPPAPVHPKKPVPCYFFSQGCCTKGSKCQYLHGGPSTVNFQHQKEFGDKQHDNVGPSPMVYRLSDSSKSGPASDTSKPKLAKPTDDSSMPDADIKRETTQQSTANREQGARKDNVYRLQDDPKKGKPALATTVTSRETPEAGSDHSIEQPGLKHRADTDLRNRIGKQQKESYTWKLSENPSQKQQPAESHQRRQEKHCKGAAANQEQGEVASRASRSVDRKRASHRNSETGTSMSRSSDKMTQGLDGTEAKEMADFVGPKSLAQIKKEKRKHSDTDEPAAAANSKVRRKSFSEGDDRNEHLRRRLSNGSAGTSSSDIESMETHEDGGAAVESKPDIIAPNGGVENAEEAAAPAMFISEEPATAADNGGPKDQIEAAIKANNNNNSNTENDVVVEMQGGSEDEEDDDFAQKLGGLFS